MSGTTATVFQGLWDHFEQRERQYLFLVLLAFLGSFGFIRLSTRLMRSPKVPWWPGSVVSDSGVHVHHLVFGIVAMMLGGTISFAVESSFWYGFWAVVFGIGMGLTIDEYALWLRLRDVYWAKEGRSSIDAALIAVVFIALLLLVATPEEISTDSLDTFFATTISLLSHLLLVGIALSKGRVAHALFGTFIPGLALYAALRLGKPGSMWGKRRYGARNPRKEARADRRFRPDRRTAVFKEQLRDAIGGVTEEEYQARLAAASTPVNPTLDDR